MTQCIKNKLYRHIENIEELDVLSYFTILSMTSEFGEDVLVPARALVEKLKSWYRVIMKEWSQGHVDQTFQDIIDLMKNFKVAPSSTIY